MQTIKLQPIPANSLATKWMVADYITQPGAITRRSHAIINSRWSTSIPSPIATIATRLIHACGQPSIGRDLDWHGPVELVARQALAQGAPIFTDGLMTAYGIHRPALTANNSIRCLINDPIVAEQSVRRDRTRSAIAVEHWSGLQGAIVAIGNAPTALFRLLEILKESRELPAVIFAFPVGFVGAAESKRLLIAQKPVPYLTLRGYRGGSALAAAAINAVLLNSAENLSHSQ